MWPAFLAREVRAAVGPFALWAPRPVGPLQRWWGVEPHDPTKHYAVITSPAWNEDLAVLESDEDARAARRRDELSSADLCWVARRAHPGLRLSELLARDTQGAPPVDLLVAVARALTRGDRTLRPVQHAADIVVGVDGVITIDGFDDPRPVELQRWRAPTLADDAGCRALVAAVLAGVAGDNIDVEALLRRVRDEGVDVADERRFVAAVVQVLAPEVVARVREEADELSLLGAAAWSSWATIEGVQPVFDDVLDMRRIAELHALVREGRRPGEDILGQLAALLERDSRVRVDVIESAWRDSRAKDAYDVAQALKGAASTMGAVQVVSLARQTQQANRDWFDRGSDAFDPHLIERLRSAVEAAIVALRATFGSAPLP